MPYSNLLSTIVGTRFIASTIQACLRQPGRDLSRPYKCLLSQFETNVSNLNDIAKAGGKSVTRRLIVQVGAIGAASVLDVPGTIAKPHASMFARDEGFWYLYGTGRAAPDGCLGHEIKARAWSYLAGSAIHHNEMTDDGSAFAASRLGDGRRFAQIACNGDDYLHEKKVEQYN